MKKVRDLTWFQEWRNFRQVLQLNQSWCERYRHSPEEYQQEHQEIDQYCTQFSGNK